MTLFYKFLSKNKDKCCFRSACTKKTLNYPAAREWVLDMKKLFWRSSYSMVMMFSLLGVTFVRSPIVRNDILLKVGIIQRFGAAPKDKLQILPLKGDRLRLKLLLERNIQQTIFTSNPIQLETVTKKLPQPELAEILVLGNYRTYETAEDSAQKWHSQGIEVEIAQPEHWQVWAKRDVYSTPLLRRLLLQDLQTSGDKEVYLDTKLRQQLQQVNLVVNGQNYNSNYLEISSSRHLLRVNREEKRDNTNLYPGSIILQPNAYGTYTLVNEVPLETYIRGVLPDEIGNDVPKAAAEAQAIIARTYALRNLRRFAIDNYQLCADTNCQVYSGLSRVSTNTDWACASTRGLVLTYNQELIDALYSSNTGGVTAAFSDIWRGSDRPYLRPKLDATTSVWDLSTKTLNNAHNFQQFMHLQTGFNESGWSFFRWRRETSMQDITKGLQKFLQAKNSPYAKLHQVQSLAVTKRSLSGHILELAVKSDAGSFVLYKDEVRSAFTAPMSTLFYLQPLNKDKPYLWGYAFIGGGLGHGVGLSQIGTQSLARAGWSSAKILQFYYPHTRIQILNKEIKFFSN